MLTTRSNLSSTRRLFFVVVVTGVGVLLIPMATLLLTTTKSPLIPYVLRNYHQQQHQLQPLHQHVVLDAACAAHNQQEEIEVRMRGPVINAHPYDFIISNIGLCGGGGCNDSEAAAGPLLLVYVQTGPTNFQRRNRIRQTWAKEDNYHGVRLRTIFVVGQRGNGELQAQLEMEARRHGDIVQENFTDTYKNLTYKGIAALKWITKNCPQVAYVIKVDDDTFVNMYTVVKHLKDLYASSYRSRLIMCHVWWHGRVFRRGKWGVPEWIVPQRVYPPYCSGLFVVMSADVVRAAYRVSFYVRFFWVDDVYVTGQLIAALRKHVNVSREIGAGNYRRRSKRKASNKRSASAEMANVGDPAVNHVDIGVAMCNQTEMAELYTHETEWYKYVFTHVHDNHLFWTTWRALQKMAHSRTIPTPSVIKPGVFAEKYSSLYTIFPDIERRWRRWKKHEKRRLSNELLRMAE